MVRYVKNHRNLCETFKNQDIEIYLFKKVPSAAAMRIYYLARKGGITFALKFKKIGKLNMRTN